MRVTRVCHACNTSPCNTPGIRKTHMKHAINTSLRRLLLLTPMQHNRSKSQAQMVWWYCQTIWAPVGLCRRSIPSTNFGSCKKRPAIKEDKYNSKKQWSQIDVQALISTRKQVVMVGGLTYWSTIWWWPDNGSPTVLSRWHREHAYTVLMNLITISEASQILQSDEGGGDVYC